MKTHSYVIASIIFVTLLAACSSVPAAQQAIQPTQPSLNNPTPNEAVVATPLEAAKVTTLQLGQATNLGSFLTDTKGMTLYLFTNDTPNVSNCYDACAKVWPPLLLDGVVNAGQGVDSTLLGSTKRTDGTLQVTYRGWPLYFFAKDAKAGDASGEGVKGVWFVVSPAGEKVEPPGTVVASAPTTAAQPTATMEMSAATAAPVALGNTNEISISNFAFDPSPLTVKVGTTVTWTNLDGAPHNVIADNGEFKSGTLSKGETFSFTFDKEGTYAYYCSFHGGPNGNGMSGQIIVAP